MVSLSGFSFVNDYKDGGGGAEGQFFTERPLMNMSFKMIDEEELYISLNNGPCVFVSAICVPFS